MQYNTRNIQPFADCNCEVTYKHFAIAHCNCEGTYKHLHIAIVKANTNIQTLAMFTWFQPMFTWLQPLSIEMKFNWWKTIQCMYIVYTRRELPVDTVDKSDICKSLKTDIEMKFYWWVHQNI